MERVSRCSYDAAVSLNGKLLAHHEGGYSTFRVNLTEALQAENVLTVSVDNSKNDRVYQLHDLLL